MLARGRAAFRRGGGGGGGRFDYELGKSLDASGAGAADSGHGRHPSVDAQATGRSLAGDEAGGISGNRVRAALPRKMKPAFLVMAAIALAIIAVARPQWGEHDEAAIANTREVIIALDLSHSMLTEDVAALAPRSRTQGHGAAAG